MTVYTRVRHFNVPDIRRREGGLVIAANHQSFLDPVLVGMGLAEPISYMARRSLFRVRGLRELMAALDTHPITLGGVDSAALKTIMGLLDSGGVVLMFPEGTRAHDGSLGWFRPGAAAIATRCGVPVLPVCIEGAYACWPRTRALPRPGRVAVAYGEPLEPGGQSAGDLTLRLHKEVEKLQVFLRGYLRRWST